MSSSSRLSVWLGEELAYWISRNLNAVGSNLYSAGILVIMAICGVILFRPSMSIPLSKELYSWMVCISYFSFPSLVSPVLSVTSLC